MIERGEDLRFALEARQAIRVSCQRRREDLDSDLTLQRRVRGPIDFPHPTHAEQRGDFVDAEAGAGREGQAMFVDYTVGTVQRLDYSCVTPHSLPKVRQKLRVVFVRALDGAPLRI